MPSGLRADDATLSTRASGARDSSATAADFPGPATACRLRRLLLVELRSRLGCWNASTLWRGRGRQPCRADRAVAPRDRGSPLRVLTNWPRQPRCPGLSLPGECPLLLQPRKPPSRRGAQAGRGQPGRRGGAGRGSERRGGGGDPPRDGVAYCPRICNVRHTISKRGSWPTKPAASTVAAHSSAAANVLARRAGDGCVLTGICLRLGRARDGRDHFRACFAVLMRRGEGSMPR